MLSRFGLGLTLYIYICAEIREQVREAQDVKQEEHLLLGEREGKTGERQEAKMDKDMQMRRQTDTEVDRWRH